MDRLYRPDLSKENMAKFNAETDAMLSPMP